MWAKPGASGPKFQCIGMMPVADIVAMVRPW